jgi:hypothetical protein
MSRPVDLDKLRSINLGGKHRDDSRVRVLKSDVDGHTTGYEVDYQDGRVEAVVRPAPIRASQSISSGEVHVG